MIVNKTSVINGVHRTKLFFFEHPVLLVLVLGLLFLALFVGIPMLKEKYDKMVYDSKTEKLDESIKQNELNGVLSNAKGETSNEEGNKKYEEFKVSNGETQHLRNEVAAKNRQIEELRRRANSAGQYGGSNAGNDQLCTRAKSLGVRCGN